MSKVSKDMTRSSQGRRVHWTYLWSDKPKSLVDCALLGRTRFSSLLRKPDQKPTAEQPSHFGAFVGPQSFAFENSAITFPLNSHSSLSIFDSFAKNEKNSAGTMRHSTQNSTSQHKISYPDSLRKKIEP